METQIATRIDARIKKAVDTACEKTGYKLRRFVEEALLDKIEDILDTEDVKHLRKEETVSFEAVVKSLKRHGKL